MRTPFVRIRLGWAAALAIALLLGTAAVAHAAPAGPAPLPPVALGDLYLATEDTPLVEAPPAHLANDMTFDGLSGPLQWTGFGAASGTPFSTAAGGMILPVDPLLGGFIYVPPTDFYGSDSFQYSISDLRFDPGPPNEAVATVSIEVAGVNDPPTMDQPADITADEDTYTYLYAWITGISAGPANEAVQGLYMDVTGNDNPGLFATGPVVGTDGTVYFDPAPDANGTANITVTLTDDDTYGAGTALSDSKTFAITINPVNDAPIISGGSDIRLQRNLGPQTISGWVGATPGGGPDELSQNISYDVTVSDPSLFLTQPAVAPDGTLTFETAPDIFGLCTISVTAWDDGTPAMSSDTLTFEVEVFNGSIITPAGYNANDGPMGDDVMQEATLPFPALLAGRFRTTAGVTTNGHLQMSDTGAGGAFYSTWDTLLSHGQVDFATMLSDQAGGYDPVAGRHAVTYGTGTWNGRTVFCANWLEHRDLFYSGYANRSLYRFQVVLVDRSDVEYGAFDVMYNYERVADTGVTRRVGYTDGTSVDFEFPTSGTDAAFQPGSAFDIIQNGTEPSQPGRYWFQVRGGTVVPFMSNPSANDDQYTVVEDGYLGVSGTNGVMRNDADLYGAGLTPTLETLPANGTLYFYGDGSFQYWPNTDFYGQDSFTYTVSNGSDVSRVATVLINVTGVYDPPMAVSDSYTTDEDVDLKVDAPGVLGNDWAIGPSSSTMVAGSSGVVTGRLTGDGGVIFAEVTTPPSHGQLLLAGDGAFLYQPDPDYNGPDSFWYRDVDSIGFSAPVEVTIDVLPVNDAPSDIALDNATVDENLPAGTLVGTLSSTDVDSSSFTYSITGGADAADFSIVGDQLFTAVPFDFETKPSLDVKITSDDGAATFEKAFTITVGNVSDAPTAVADEYSMSRDATLTVAVPGVLANDTDPENDPLTVTGFGAPANGSIVSFNPTGDFVYKPAAGFVGDDTVTYTMSDGTTTVTGSVTIHVLTTGTASRAGGADRYEVAANAAAAAFPGWQGVTHVIIACGEDRAAADPLTAAGLAGVYRAPVLLARTNLTGYLPPATVAALTAIRNANGSIAIHVIGGTGSIPYPVYQALGRYKGPVGTIDRVAGADRYELSANIAQRAAALLSARVPMANNGVLVANGNMPAAFFDALAAGPVAYARNLPIVLVKSNAVPASVAALLKTPTFTGKPRYVVNAPYYVNAGVASALGATARMTSSTSRYQAAADIATFAVAKGWLTWDHVGVTNKLMDAVTGGVSMGESGGPLLMTGASPLDPVTDAILRANAATILDATVYGGTASITDATKNQVQLAIQ